MSIWDPPWQLISTAVLKSMVCSHSEKPPVTDGSAILFSSVPPQQVWRNYPLAFSCLVYILRRIVWKGRWSACAISCIVPLLHFNLHINILLLPWCFSLHVHTWLPCWSSPIFPQAGTARIPRGCRELTSCRQLGAEIPAFPWVPINAPRFSWCLDDISVCVKGWGAQSKPNLILSHSCSFFIFHLLKSDFAPWQQSVYFVFLIAGREASLPWQIQAGFCLSVNWGGGLFAAAFQCRVLFCKLSREAN